MIASRYEELRSGTKVDLLMDLHLSQTLHPLFTLVKADNDKNLLSKAQRDLQRILPVKLKNKEMNLGAESGKRLRQLRTQLLANKHKK